MGNDSLSLSTIETLSTYMIGNEMKYENENAIIKTFEISSSENTVIYFEGIARTATFEKMIEGLDSVELLTSKINFLKTALRNRTKQYNFTQLTCQLLEDCISESEFDKEIDDHYENYAISISDTPIKISDLDVLTSLITELKNEKTLNDNISVDEVSELFEVNLENITERIARLKLAE